MQEGPTYYYNLFNTSLAVDYIKEGERWIELLRAGLSEQNSKIIGHGLRPTAATDNFPYSHLKMNLNGVDGEAIDIPNLLILHGGTDANGTYVLLESSTEITKPQVDVWTKAIKYAEAELANQNTKEFAWEAAIGQVRELGRSEQYSLKSQTKVGHLLLRSSGKLYVHSDANTIPRFNSGSFNMTYPIIVTGTATGYDWTEASREASRDLNNLLGLLSVAWKSTWQVLHSPQPKQPQSLQIPQNKTGIRPIPYRRLGMPSPKHRRTIPKWLPGAFEKTGEDKHVANALDTYHQGLLMEIQHLSFALLAFVSSIETIGKKLNPNVGNKKRFITGLETVTKTKAKAKEIADAYKPRSYTAHEARLHGNEALIGYVGMPSIFNPNPADTFAIFDVAKIKHVSRRVLQKQLKNL